MFWLNYSWSTSQYTGERGKRNFIFSDALVGGQLHCMQPKHTHHHHRQSYNATQYNIKAAVTHHAFTHSFPPISSIPFLVFTGTDDDVASRESIYPLSNQESAREH